MKFDNYYLDLEKLKTVEEKEEKEQIHRYYIEMMHCFHDNRNSMGVSLFNTLNQSGYLKELRAEKIDKILS